jgi:hypothetical protein
MEEIMEDNLTPEATAVVQRLADEAAAAARHAFRAGAEQGAGAFKAESRPASLDEWRTLMLARYGEPSWKRSIIELFPSLRSRPSEIYTGRQAELSVRHPDNKSLSVGTHNALEALRKDGVIVKTEDGYAPAFDFVPLPVDSNYAATAFRPASTIGDNHSRLLGAALWTYKILEWEIVHLTNTLEPGYVSQSHDRAGDTFAADFAAAVEKFAHRLNPGLSSRLQTLSDDFSELVQRYTALLYARPCSIDGENTLSYAGVHKRNSESSIVWSEAMTVQTAKDFERVAREANNLQWRSRFHEEIAMIADLEALNLGKLRDPDVRIAAAVAKTAIEKSLIPLIAISHVSTPYGALPYAEALGRAGVIGADETNAIVKIAREIEHAQLGETSTSIADARPIIEELWRLARSPGIVQRALAVRARSANKASTELPRPLPGPLGLRTPVLSVGPVTISVATSKCDIWDDVEIVVDLEHRYRVPASGAMVFTYGSRVVGTKQAIELAPWLVDDPVGEDQRVA